MSSFRQSRPDYIAVSSDALEDVQVKVAASDASAPLGNGVVINIATPSGTNQLKGSRLRRPTRRRAGTPTTTRTGRPTSARSSKWTSRRAARSSATSSGSSAATGRPSASSASTGAPRSSTITRFSTPAGSPFNNTFEGDSALVKANGRVNDRHMVEAFYQWDDYPTTSNEAVDNANVQVQAYGGKGYSGRLNSVWNNSFSTRISASFNDKALNDTFSDYDGYIGTGPSRPVHAGHLHLAGQSHRHRRADSSQQHRVAVPLAGEEVDAVRRRDLVQVRPGWIARAAVRACCCNRAWSVSTRRSTRTTASRRRKWS